MKAMERLWVDVLRLKRFSVILYRLGLIFELIHTDWISHLLFCFLYKTPNHTGGV